MTALDAVRKSLNKWQTIPEITWQVKRLTGIWFQGQTISARIRDLRKARYGGHTVARQYVHQNNGSGVYEYKLG